MNNPVLHVLVLSALTLVGGLVHATEYYVDSAAGDDARDGKSETTCWKTLDKVNAAPLVGGDVVRFRRGGLWRGSLKPKSGKEGRPVVYSTYGKGPKPILQQSLDMSKPEDWTEEKSGLWTTRRGSVPCDVGIFIVNHGERWGVKKWNSADWAEATNARWRRTLWLEDELDYWYDPEGRRVVVKYPENPGKALGSIELALTRHVVSEAGCRDVTYEGLWIRYGAAHGFGGGSVANIVIRNCDICWIGGGLQYFRKNEKTGKLLYPVRYGNGIEFWGNCRNCLIERCRLWEVYDAAVTNQGRESDEFDVIWRDNVIWNSEYSYEYWNAGRTRNVLFEHNTCVDAGHGWAHAQRPDRNGAHLMYYHNRAETSNFVVRDNIFCRATEWTVRSGLDWRSGLLHDRNLVYNDGGVPVMRWLDGKKLRLCDWKDYLALGFDPQGCFAEPKFVNPEKRDYRLRPDSPGLTLAHEGTPVGARDMPGLDRDQSACGPADLTAGASSATTGVFGVAERIADVCDKAQSLAIEGDVLYCGAGDALHVFDVSEPLKPKLLAKVGGFVHLRQIAVEKGWVAVASRAGGAWLVDARNPAKPVVANHFETVEQATGIDLCGNLLMVGQRANGVEFIDITDRTHPLHIRMVKTPESQSVLYEDGYVYSGDWHAGATTVIDARDLSKAQVVASTAMQGLGDGLDLEASYIYASTGHHRLRGRIKDTRHPENWGAGHGLEIWDRSDIAHPRFVSRVQFPQFWRLGNDMWTVRVSDGWAFCADTYNGLFAVDVHDPAHPKVMDRFCAPNPKDAEAPSFCVTYLALGRGVVYATTDGGGLWAIPCAVAKPRMRVRGKPIADVSWRDAYPTPPGRLEAWQPPQRGQVHSVAGYRDFLYAGCSAAGAYVVGPDFKTAGALPCGYARDVVVRGDLLYVAEGDAGLGIYSLEDPVHPREVRRIADFGSGVKRCEWAVVPTARWVVCADRATPFWRFVDLDAAPQPKTVLTVHNLGWVKPFADGLVGGKWLGYAHTHSFFKWFDFSGEVPRLLDTADPQAKGPLKQRPNALMSQTGCAVVHGKVLVTNERGFIWLEPGQNRNPDGSAWPHVPYAKVPEDCKSDPRICGMPVSDGKDLVLVAYNNRKTVRLVSVRDEQKPELLWQEKTLGFPENPLFHNGRFYVPCGYQGVLRVGKLEKLSN